VGNGSVALTYANIISALGYTPENVANKSDSYTASSSTTYASTKALVDGLAVKETVYNVNEFLQKNINVTNLVPLGVDSAAGNTVDTAGNIVAIGGLYKYKSFTNIIEPSTTYVLDGTHITQGTRISYRDISNNVLGVYYTPTVTNSADGKAYQIHELSPIKFTTPANCVTILVNTIGADGVDPTPNLTLTKGTYTFDYYSGISKWVGKKIHWLGDSMTEQNILQAKVQSELKTIHFLNGVGGSLITPNFEDIVPDAIRRGSFVERAKNNTLFPSDMFVVYGGYNDYGYGAPIGNVTDNLTPSFDGVGHIVPASVAGATFCASLNYIIKYFATTFPDKPIRLITQTYNGVGSPSTYAAQEAYANAMIKIANINNVPVLDLFHGSGMNPENISTYTVDGVHYTDAGAELVAKKVIHFLNSGIGGTTSSVYGDGLNGELVIWGDANSQSGNSRLIWNSTDNRLESYGKIMARDDAGSDTINLAHSIMRVQGSSVGLFSGILNGTPNYGSWLQATQESFGANFPLHLNPLGGNITINTTTDNGYPLNVNGAAYIGASLRVIGLAGTGDRMVVAQPSGVTYASEPISNIALLSSPAFTGTPTAPTATAGTNTTQIATTAFVQGEKALTVRKISTNTTLADSDNGTIVLLTASCTVTLPNGLMSGFNCSFSTQTGATLTYALGGSVTLINNVGTTMAQNLSHTIVNTGTSNEYLTAGSL